MVVEAAPGSTVPRRQLGRYLRDARGRARMSVRAAAEALEWSETKIWRIEVRHEALLFRVEVEDLRRFAVVAVG
jgi:hypothetical protein